MDLGEPWHRMAGSAAGDSGAMPQECLRRGFAGTAGLAGLAVETSLGLLSGRFTEFSDVCVYIHIYMKCSRGKASAFGGVLVPGPQILLFMLWVNVKCPCV